MHKFEPKLTLGQKTLRQKAKDVAFAFRKCEWQLVEIIRQVDAVKLFRHLGYASLFRYSVDELKLSESQAYSFITVARRASEIPELAESLRLQKVSVSKASRMASVVSKENAAELIQYAQAHSIRELDFEVARRNPRAPRIDRIKPESEESVRISVSVSRECLKKIKRIQDLLAQKGKRYDLESALNAMCDEYLKRHDPVIRANRALSKQAAPTPENRRNKVNKEESGSVQQSRVHSVRHSNDEMRVSSNALSNAGSVFRSTDEQGCDAEMNSSPELGTLSHSALLKQSFSSSVEQNRQSGVSAEIHVQNRQNQREMPLKSKEPKDSKSNRNSVTKRKPVAAHQKHWVMAAKQGRCAFIDLNGQRCSNERYLHIHHIRPVSLGGSNDPENLTLLCSDHHALVHQLSFPIDGQVSWLRAPIRAYQTQHTNAVFMDAKVS